MTKNTPIPSSSPGLLASFRSRILVGYGGAIAVVVLTFCWTVSNLFTLGQAADLILRENYRSILAAEHMSSSLERQNTLLLSWMLGRAPDAPSEFTALSSTFQQWLGRALDNITIHEETAVLQELQAASLEFDARGQDLLRSDPASPAAMALYQESVLPPLTRLFTARLLLREINERAMFDAGAAAQQTARAAVWRTSLAGLATFLLGLGFSIFLAARLARPVEEMREAAFRLAEGDYDVAIAVRGNDEISQLALQFNAMARRIKHFHDLNIGNILAEKHKNEAIIQSVDDGLVVVDPDDRIATINPAAGRAFGKEHRETEGRHFLEAFGDERIFTLIRQARDTGRAQTPPENERLLSRRIKDTAWHWQISVMPVRVGEHPVRDVIVLLRDVTRLAELDRLKSEFVMTASHELRTPLTSIGMSVEMLLEKAADKLSAKERQLLQVAVEDVARLKALINELLDLSKIEAGRLELDLTQADPAVFCEKTAQIMIPQAEEKGVALAFSCVVDTLRVRADANKITWVLVNLVGNALRHTPRGGHVRVEAGRAGEFLHISVHDDGEGIPQEYQSTIFDKFVQVRSGSTAGGSGLGLAICREIVRAHGGAIWVESQPGAGSVFTFTLPLAP